MTEVGQRRKLKGKKKGVRREKFISVRREVVPRMPTPFDSRPLQKLIVRLMSWCPKEESPTYQTISSDVIRQPQHLSPHACITNVPQQMFERRSGIQLSRSRNFGKYLTVRSYPAPIFRHLLLLHIFQILLLVEMRRSFMQPLRLDW